MTPKFPGTIKDGKLTLHHKEDFAKYLFSLTGEVDLTVSKHKNTRSIQQNRWIWGIAYRLISDHCGHSVDDVHEFLKDKLGLKKLIVGINKDKKPYKSWIIKSTTQYTTMDMTNYMNAIQQWASMELDLVIPDPNQVEAEQGDFKQMS